MWSKDLVDPKSYNFLTLKTKSGKWLSPDKILFSKEYKPEHNLEILVEKHLLDLPLEFLSPIYIENENETSLWEWRMFFKEIGVDKKIEREKKNIIQRIGILVSLEFEKKKGRTPQELGESEKLGYDIKSTSKSEERYIEVKSSENLKPDIFLTPNEYAALGSNREKYFVYVVTDALRKPKLYINRGDKLSEISEMKVILTYNQWYEHVESEVFQPLE